MRKIHTLILFFIFGVCSGQTVLQPSGGGTGNGSYTAGDLLIATGQHALAKLPVGSAGKVLTVSAGLPSWQTAASGGWALTGNSGTNSGTNFLGTTDNVSLRFKTNNIQRMYMDSNGIFGIVNYLNFDNTNQATYFGRNTTNRSKYNNITSFNTYIGYNVGMSDTTGQYNTCVGSSIMPLATNPTYNTLIGDNMAGNCTSCADLVGIGVGCYLATTTGHRSQAIGAGAMQQFTTGSDNQGFGTYALQSLTDAIYCTAIGSSAGSSNSHGISNVTIGAFSGYNFSGGDDNTMLGVGAGYGILGGAVYRNVLIGRNAGRNLAFNSSDLLVIDNKARDDDFSTKTKALITGTFGNDSSNQFLRINGKVTISDGTQANGKVFTSNSTGQGSWQVPSGGFNTTMGTGAISQSFAFMDSTQTELQSRGVINISDIHLDSSDMNLLATNLILNAVSFFQINIPNADSGKVLTCVDNTGTAQWRPMGQLLHTIFTPTVGATVTTKNNQINIISPAGTLASLTIKFPNSPSNNDFIEVTFDQVITSVTYSAGTGGATIKGQINGTVGSQKRWDYDSGTNTWY